MCLLYVVVDDYWPCVLNLTSQSGARYSRVEYIWGLLFAAEKVILEVVY